MNRVPTKGYDPLCDYSVEELVNLYRRQGLNETEAAERAKITAQEIHRMNIREQRLWDRVRAHEIPVGLVVDSTSPLAHAIS